MARHAHFRECAIAERELQEEGTKRHGALHRRRTYVLVCAAFCLSRLGVVKLDGGPLKPKSP